MRGNLRSKFSKMTVFAYIAAKAAELRVLTAQNKKTEQAAQATTFPQARASRCAASAASWCGSSSELRGGARRSPRAERASEASEHKKGHARALLFLARSFSRMFSFSSSERPK